MNMYKAQKKIKVDKIKNGIVLPRIFKSNGPGWGLGGVCNKKNDFIESSAYHGGWIDMGGAYSWSNEVYIDEDVFYFGLFFKHWGHFLMDLTSRLWIIPLLKDKSNVKIVYIGEDEIEGNYLEFFMLLGIKVKQIMHIDTPTRFRNVFIPHISMRACIWYSEEYMGMINTIIQNALLSCTLSNTYDKVYFTRLAFSKAKKTEIGEKEICKIFQENSFKIFSPENLTLIDQIYIWNNSKEIVCLNGSIPLNCIFCCNKDLKFVILNKTSLEHLNLKFFSFVRRLNSNYIDVYCEPFIRLGIPKSIGSGPFLLKVTINLIEYSKQEHLNLKCIGYYKFKYFLNYIKYLLMIINIKANSQKLALRIINKITMGDKNE